MGVVYGLYATFLVTETFVPDADIAGIDYRLTLLKRVPGPRVLIDSGSNSLWSIYPEMLTNILGIPSFVVAENGSVPIDFKLRKWKKYLRSGDIVVLPLEYTYYHKNDITSSFVEELFGTALSSAHDLNETVILNVMSNYAYHYHFMNFLEKIEFIRKHVNPNNLINARYQRLREPSFTEQLNYRLDHLKDLAAKQTGGDVKDDTNRVRHRLTSEKSCFEYIQSYPAHDEAIIEHIASELARIQKENGATFIITWPAVAGTDCYDNESIKKLVKQVRRIFERNGVQVVGDPEDSNFSELHLLDTYFHVDTAAARARTQKLALHLLSAINKERFLRTTVSLKELSKKAVVEEEARIDILLVRSTAPIFSGEYLPKEKSFSDYFRLSSEGWSIPEGWGIWSLGTHSRIYFKVATDGCVLYLKGHQFLNSSSTFHLFTQDGDIVAFSNSVDLPKNSGVAVIEITHNAAAKPRQPEEVADDRMLGFGLEKISVNCPAH